MEKGTLIIRTNVLVLLVIIICSMSFASPWSINVSGGLGLGSMNSSPTIGKNVDFSKLGGGFSVCAAYSINNWLNIRSGFDYQAKGYFRNLSLTMLNLTGKHDAVEFYLNACRDYIQIPVFVSITVPTRIRIHPFVEIGPSLAFNVNAKDKLTLKVTDSYIDWEQSPPAIEEETDEQTESVNPMENNESAFRKFDLPVTIATGMRISLRDFEVQFCIRYDIGLLSFVKDKSGDVDNRYIISYGDKNAPEIAEYTERYNSLLIMVGVNIPIVTKKSKNEIVDSKR